jgi:twitching motility protein PilI
MTAIATLNDHATSAALDAQRLGAVYRRRAECLANRERRQETSTRRTPVLAVQIGTERFAVELAHVSQVFPRTQITPIPGADGLLLGVANLNGSLASVIDLGELLNVATTETSAGYIVLLEVGPKRLSFWVEAMDGVRAIDLASLTDVDEATAEKRNGLVRGATEDHLLVLDAASMIPCVAQRLGRRAKTI